MEKENKKTLTEFTENQKFSDVLLQEIFKKSVTDYKHETTRQSLIRALVGIYNQRYPEEMAEHAKVIKAKREALANEFGADDQGQRNRSVFNLPEGLYKRLEMLVKDPPFLSQSNPMTKEEMDEWSWFFSEFPQFRVADKF